MTRFISNVTICLCFLITMVAQAHYIPGATDVCEIEQAWVSVGTEPEGTYLDWRDVGGNNYMSPVEDQSTTGLCWAFGSSHGLVTRIKIEEGLGFTDDFSEDAIGDCSYPAGPTYGGNFWKAGAYFSALGPVLESCQPWVPSSVSCDPCPQQDYRLKTLRTIASNTSAIKAALVNGPVVTSMDTDVISGFDFYDGSYVITSGSSTTTNHCVLIIGYHEGTGDPGYFDGNYWICKNSWGSSWGDNGYFYIGYGVANIGNANGQYWEWEDSLESRNAELLFADEAGAGSYYTGMPNTIYACQRLQPSQDGQITQVQWANAGNNFSWAVQIFDSMAGGNLYTPLMSQVSGTNEPYGGIVTLDLPVPIDITAGNDIYVAVRMNNPTAGVHPCDAVGPASGTSYWSTTNISSGYSVLSGTDWAIRATVEDVAATATPSIDTPATGPVGIGALLLIVGLLTGFRRRK